MKPILPCSILACAFIGAGSAHAAVTLYAEYLLGEPGTLDANNAPLDTLGLRNITTTINPGEVSVGGGGAHGGSSAHLDTSNPANSGYYDAGANFSDLPTNNVAIGVYARASAIAGNTGTIFGTGDLGLDLSLSSNGWAGSIFNVAWVGPAGGVSGSFIPDAWVHLALIRADGVSTFYIDGVAQAGTSNAAIINSLPHVSVAPGGAVYFDGGIDEARVVTFDSGESTAAILTALQGVPEPSSLALLGLGCASLFRRRR